MPLLRTAQRHTIAAAASVLLLTPGLALLAQRGLLDELASPITPVRSAALLAFGLTFLLFVPAGAFFDWAVDRTRLPSPLAPIFVAVLFALFWLGVEAAVGTFAPGFIPHYFLLGLMVGAAFCAYWIPLRFLRRRAGA